MFHPLIWPQSGRELFSFQDISLFSSCNSFWCTEEHIVSAKALLSLYQCCLLTPNGRVSSVSSQIQWAYRQRHHALAERYSSFKDMPETLKEKETASEKAQEHLSGNQGSVTYHIKSKFKSLLLRFKRVYRTQIPTGAEHHISSLHTFICPVKRWKSISCDLFIILILTGILTYLLFRIAGNCRLIPCFRTC